jgi:ferrous iron transport protein B
MLKKTKLFAGETSPFLMELPQYHVPSLRNTLLHMWERSRAFIIKAGTVIFIASGVIWFLSSFGFENGSFGLIESDKSLLAVLGTIIAPIFAPLGFGSWEATVATLSGLLAKENVVATFGVLFGISDAGENNPVMWAAFSGMFTTASAASFLVFNMLCAPCFAAIGAIRREMASAKWTWFAIGYQSVLAYSLSLIVYQIIGITSGEFEFGAGSVAAVLIAFCILYMLFRPNKYSRPKLIKKAAA